MRQALQLGLRLPAFLVWTLLGLFWAVTGFRFLSRSYRQLSIRIFARGVLWLCGVRLGPNLQGLSAELAKRVPSPSLVVANHISWLDIFLVHAVLPATFIAKSEIRSWPLAGLLVQASGTIFVERGNRHAVRSLMKEAMTRLDLGERVIFFPEGTTSRGESVLKFHTSLFGLAEQRSDLAVVPMTLFYSRADSAAVALPPTDATARDPILQAMQQVAYVDDMTLVGSMIQIMGHPGLKADALVHAALASEGRSRQELADLAYQAVRAGLEERLSMAGCWKMASSSNLTADR
jgi:1-acyl-sn-glycerol-3-phosphate acyltransferase